VPSTASTPSVDSPETPNTPVPQVTLFCESEPPTVAVIPEKGPKNGVRKPLAASVSLKRGPGHSDLCDDVHVALVEL
jgi:hypothetical protein